MVGLSVCKIFHGYFNAQFMQNLMVHYPTKTCVQLTQTTAHIQADQEGQVKCCNYSELTKLGAT